MKAVKSDNMPAYSDRLKEIRAKKMIAEDERNMARLYEMAKEEKERQKQLRRDMRLRHEMDPIMKNVHDRMHMVLMSKSERRHGEIMFRPNLLADVINKFDGQYSEDSDSDGYKQNDKVRKIVKKNIKNESSTTKIDKLLALNDIRTYDVHW